MATVKGVARLRAEMAAAPAPRDPLAAYTERGAYFTRLRTHYNRRRYLWANVSVVAFLSAIALFTAWLFAQAPILLITAVLALLVFIAAFARQAQLDEIHHRYVALCDICEQGLARLRRDWSSLALRETPDTPTPGLNAADLDLSGHASLQHLLNTVTTPAGQARLISWLTEPATPSAARERQTAVRELASDLETRDELTLFGMLAHLSPTAQQRFAAWASDVGWLTTRRWLDVYSVVALVSLVALALAQLTGVLPYPFWLLPIALNMVVYQFQGKEIERQIERVADQRGAFLPYQALFDYLGAKRFSAPALQRARDNLAAQRDAAAPMLRSLARRMRFADMRLSSIGPALQLAFLWNVHALRLLENWRERAGSQARTWLDLATDLEALAGLAALAFDNPDWTYPEITDTPQGALTARELGHPLLPPDTCVGNDVTLGPPGTLLLVTGSNMSGKSTLLRALGLNITLAQAGGPVCARFMRLPPMALATSMRAEDSLAQGVSYFMAELRRLKVVVDELRRVAAEGERVPVFLLDEILTGTNTGERQIAARTVIRSLLALGATGAVSTHDLTLIDTPDLQAASAPVHFAERFTRGLDGPSMSFDYLLKPGIATSVNALALMEIVGLPLPEPQDDADATPKPVIH